MATRDRAQRSGGTPSTAQPSTEVLIVPFVEAAQAEVGALSLRAWEPVFLSLQDCLDPAVFGHFFHDWRVAQPEAVTGRRRSPRQCSVRGWSGGVGPAAPAPGMRRSHPAPPADRRVSQGVKANVLFFDKKPGQEEPWTKELWIYDLRTNQHFTLKQNPLSDEALADFIEAYNPDERHARVESERFRRFAYKDLIARDKLSLDIIWLRDESLEDTDNLPPPAIIAAEIAEDLEAALAEFAEIATSLGRVETDL